MNNIKISKANFEIINKHVNKTIFFEIFLFLENQNKIV